MKKVAAFCLLDDVPWHFGERLKSSFEYFHKEIPFYLCHPNHMKDVIGESYHWPKVGESELGLNAARIEMLLQLKKAYGYDVVILFDADVVVTARLDEFIAGDYDIAGSLNVERYPGDRYFNMGVTAIANNDFAELWSKSLQTTDAWNSYGNEQEVLNLLCGTLGRDEHVFRDNPWRVKTVDKEKVYYNERSRNYWGEIQIKDDKMFCNGRQLKVMHWAGGTDFNARWSCKVFSQATRLHLNKITNTTDFTDHEGSDAHWFHH